MSSLFCQAQLYLEAHPEPKAGAFALFGAGFDGTVSFRAGARDAATALRPASIGIEDYCPILDATLLDVYLADVGDLNLPMGDVAAAQELVRKAVDELLLVGAKPLMIGGEHSLTRPAVMGVMNVWPNLAVVQLDAHADLREDYLGQPLSHASVMRRIVEQLGSDSIFQFGIRSGLREEWAFMREHHTHYPVNAESIRRVMDTIGERPVYLTIDLDILDPSIFPGTGTPEPGGEDFRTVDALIRELSKLNVVAADLMELAPGLDASGVSSVVAAKLLRTLVLGHATR